MISLWQTAACGALVALAPVLLTATLPSLATTPNSARASIAAKITRGGGELPDIVPISLADSDGQELVIEDLNVRAAIQGMLSLTEVEIRFRNPKAKRIEGRFAFTLPPDATISRFAKEVNGTLMEGEVVERLRANQVYEQFLHQMRDPALLEQDQGNRFSARIFPIDPNASVRVLLSYSSVLPLRGGARTYDFPLRGLPKMGHFSFRAFLSPLKGEQRTNAAPTSGITAPSGATQSNTDVVSIEENDYLPPHDVELTWNPVTSLPSRVMRSGDFYVASLQVPPPASAPTRPAPHSWMLYVDTSASSAEGSDHRIQALEALLSALPASDGVEVKAFDQEIAFLTRGSAAEVRAVLGDRLRSRHFLGGTDMAALYRDIGVVSASHKSAAILVASDFVSTLGRTDVHALDEAVRALPSDAIVHALILGPREDERWSRALTAGRGRIVHIPFSESMTSLARDAATTIALPLGPSFTVTDEGADWIYPTRFEDVRPGDELLVFARVKTGAKPSLRMDGNARTGSPRQEVEQVALPSGTFGPLLQREASRAFLRHLADREAAEADAGVRRALAEEQVRLSVQERIVIPRTTMLVLESESDYVRFGLDRKALAAILTVDGGGIGRLDRPAFKTTPVAVVKIASPVPPVSRREGRRAVASPPFVVPEPSVVNGEDSAGALSRDSQQAADRAEGGMAGSVVGGVAGGVAGGVVGGVAGGVAGGGPAGAPSEVADVVTVTASAPAVLGMPSTLPPPPPPVPVPETDARPRVTSEAAASGLGQVAGGQSSGTQRMRRQSPSGAEGNWVSVQATDPDDVLELQADLKGHPRDRELYNRLAEELISLTRWSDLRALAFAWQPYDPENPQVYEILGVADEHLGESAEAARADASLIEVAAAKPELLQRAGLLLARLHKARLAETPLRTALELRPDRVNSYRHLALMLWLDGRPEEAAGVLESATTRTFPDWYRDAQRVVHEELGYVYRAWMAKEPERLAEIEDRARANSVDLSRTDALRVTLDWETDANDVDLHVVDPSGEECFYSHKKTRSGLELYEDITQGLGPEVIRTDDLKQGIYHVGVRYFSAGPMGVSRGIVIVMRGAGPSPAIDILPFRLIAGGGAVRYVTAVRVK